MAKRSSRQPLYEYLRQSEGRVEPRRPFVGGGGAEGVDQWLRPGRSIRVPVGYLLVGAGLIVVLGAAAFIYGFRNGETSQRAKIGDTLFDDRSADAVAQDPMATGEQIPLTRSSRPPLFQNASPREEDLEPLPSPAEFGDLESDPRESGLHYFVLMTTRREGAKRLAEFCREQGLEAYVVPVNNSGLSQHQVIALPGFEDRSSARAEAVRRKIYEVGSRWKARNPRESDLRDAYPVRHQ